MVMPKRYIPARGDIVWLDFDPRVGHEQSGHRPALILSEQKFNEITGLAVVCPITTKAKGSSFEVQGPRLPNGDDSVILSQHVRTVDWRERKAAFKEKARGVALKDVVDRVALIIGLTKHSAS